MASLSLSLAHGEEGFLKSDFTVGTLAPNADDFELRWNTTNTLSKNISRKDVILALEAFRRALEQSNLIVTLSGGAAPPPLV